MTTSHTSITPRKEPQHRWNKGYHFGVLCCALTAGIVLFVNVILIIVTTAKNHGSAGTAIVQDGDCDETKRLDLWLHLLINVLSTLLLGASNYSMQCLAAPTRKDIDNAHSLNAWMDIGVFSIRNISRIGWPRKILWSCLFASSIPLHLLYNSVVYSSTSISDWQASGVTSDFLAGAPFNVSTGFYNHEPVNDTIARLNKLQTSTSLVRLENQACIATYTADMVSAWGDLLLVTTQPSTNNSYLQTQGTNFCMFASSSSNCGEAGPNADSWALSNASDSSVSYKVSHCMAAKAEEHCKIRFNTSFMVAVIVCNIIKAICMGIIVWRLDPSPLVTIGDAIASFLDAPDPTTKGSCLAGKSRFHKSRTWSPLPMTLRRQRRWWFASASRARWCTTTILCSLTLGAAVALLKLGIKHINSQGYGTQVNHSFSLGFGATNTAAVVDEFYHQDLAAAVLLTNSPQLLLSFLYFAYNGLWTNMLLAQEWSGYAQASKPLRVTSPAGRQRSTYRLQLPYRYGIPLLITSGLLHWFVSQSFFLVVLEGSLSTTSCGYSPIALLVTIITGTCTLLLGIANGFRRYLSSGLPLAGSCSAVISAACHPPLGDDGASLKKVMWGACRGDLDGRWDTEVDISNLLKTDGKEAMRQDGEQVRVGHCSFTSTAVEEPEEGKLYA